MQGPRKPPNPYIWGGTGMWNGTGLAPGQGFIGTPGGQNQFNANMTAPNTAGTPAMPTGGFPSSSDPTVAPMQSSDNFSPAQFDDPYGGDIPITDPDQLAALRSIGLPSGGGS